MSFDDTFDMNKISQSMPRLENINWEPLKQFDQFIPKGMILSNKEFGTVVYNPYPACDEVWKQYYT